MPVQVQGNARFALAALRLSLGIVFLWAFLDKLFGLTWTTQPASSWLQGGHPTRGYLSSSYGPLGDVFKGMAGNPIVDTLFMAGLCGVGVGLTLGIATRLAGWSGVAMVALMYLSHPAPWADPHGTNPLVDSHVMEGAALALLALTQCGYVLGLGAWWDKTVAAKATWLR